MVAAPDRKDVLVTTSREVTAGEEFVALQLRRIVETRLHERHRTHQRFAITLHPVGKDHGAHQRVVLSPLPELKFDPLRPYVRAVVGRHDMELPKVALARESTVERTFTGSR